MTAPDPLRLFHRVDTALWLCVARCLRRLILAKMENSDAPDVSWFTLDHVETLLMFLDEMECGYVHPRRTAIRFSVSLNRRAASHSSSANPFTN